MTINEGLALQKALKQRHTELTQLRNQNANAQRYRNPGIPEVVEQPLYDVKKLDTMLVAIAKEMRLLDSSIKSANAHNHIVFEHNEAVLGPIEA